jgi:sec-independent protein translocase protein TatA
LFGRGKISGMMGEMAQGIKAFQKGMKDDDKPKVIETAAAPLETRDAEKKDA